MESRIEGAESINEEVRIKSAESTGENVRMLSADTRDLKTKRNDMLKLLAMITMLIDHSGVLLFPELRILRAIGRIAFPIFAYQLAVGYDKTSDRKKYTQRLFLFGVISQVPYMFLNYEFEMNLFHFNVILFFVYAIGMLSVFNIAKNYFMKKKYFMGTYFGLATLVLIILPEVVAGYFEAFAISYGTYGLLMILVFYVFKEKTLLMIAGYIIVEFVSTYYNNGMIIAKYGQHFVGKEMTLIDALLDFKLNIKVMIELIMQFNHLQILSIFGLGSIVLLRMFEFRLKLNKYVGYIFYPAHIALLVVIRCLIGHPIM